MNIDGDLTSSHCTRMPGLYLSIFFHQLACHEPHVLFLHAHEVLQADGPIL